MVQLSVEEVIRYLDVRKDKGFTMLLVNLIENKFTSHALANRYGDLPFTGRPFATPNEAYFAHADTIIRAAAETDAFMPIEIFDRITINKIK